MLCDNCERGNWDGIVLEMHPHLHTHLKKIGVVPVMNEKGWLPIPPR